MARNRDPFTQALASLRERLLSGVLAPGAPVIVQDEAARLKLSTTPVREALACLSGEGLVQRAPSGGYVSVRLDAAAARDRYAMHGHYVRIAAELNASALGAVRPPAPALDMRQPIAAVRQLFTTIISSAGNEVLWEAYLRASGQLDRLRRLESVLFDDLAAEAAALHHAWVNAQANDFLGEVERYHARRVAAAAALAALAHRPVGPDGAVAATADPGSA